MKPQKDWHIYRMYDDNRILLYVGITGRGQERQCEHAADKEWFHLVRRTEWDHRWSYEAARKAELDAIRTELPIFNRADRRPDADDRRRHYLNTFELLGIREAWLYKLPEDCPHGNATPGLCLRCRAAAGHDPSLRQLLRREAG